MRSDQGWRARWAPTLLATLLLPALAAGGAAVQPVASITDDPAYTHAQRLVDIGGGRRMNLYCIGRGSPTVVFDAGGSDSNVFWAYVQPAVARRTRACSFDRAGLGFSDPSPRASTSAYAVDDLHALLRIADVKPPYVLVGHSYGALNMRLYANEYLPEVAGMVLLDGGNEDQLMAFAVINRGQFDGGARLERFRKCVATLKLLPRGYRPGTAAYDDCIDRPVPRLGPRINATLTRMEMKLSFQETQLSEWQNGINGVSTEELRLSDRLYGHIPLKVLIRTPNPWSLPPTQQTSQLRMRWVLFEQLSALSTAGELRGITNTSHDIELDRPDAVIAAIEDVLRSGSKSKSSISP